MGKSLAPVNNHSQETSIQQAGFQKYNSNRKTRTTSSQNPQTTARQPAPFVLTSEEAAAMKSARSQPELEAKNETQETPQTVPLVEEIRREQAPDAFDPAIFNRLKHGRTQ